MKAIFFIVIVLAVNTLSHKEDVDTYPNWDYVKNEEFICTPKNIRLCEFGKPVMFQNYLTAMNNRACKYLFVLVYFSSGIFQQSLDHYIVSVLMSSIAAIEDFIAYHRLNIPSITNIVDVVRDYRAPDKLKRANTDERLMIVKNVGNAATDEMRVVLPGYELNDIPYVKKAMYSLEVYKSVFQNDLMAYFPPDKKEALFRSAEDYLNAIRDFHEAILYEYQIPIEQEQNEHVQQHHSEPTQQHHSVTMQQHHSLPMQHLQSLPIQHQQSLPMQRQQSLPMQQHHGLPIQQHHSVPMQYPPNLPIQQRQGVPMQYPPNLPIQQRHGVPIPRQNSGPIQHQQYIPVQNRRSAQIPNRDNMQFQNQQDPRNKNVQ